MTIGQIFDDISVSDIRCMSNSALFSVPCGSPQRDSRCVRARDIYFCIRGRHHDGHTTISEAGAAGAVCTVIDDPRAIAAADAAGLPWILVRDTAAVFLPACLAYHGHPEQQLQLYAVTGTNGKTSVTYCLEAIFSEKAPCAVIGTVVNRIAGVPYRTENTTPAPEITAALLARAREAGVRYVFAEASSHALAQKRLAGLTFACGIFTNLGEDHLDYHASTDDYFRAKRSLFFACDRGLVNTDDTRGQQLYEDAAFAGKLYSYSPTGRSSDYPLSFLPRQLSDTPFSFLAANRLAAAACAHLAGIPRTDIIRALIAMPPIPGRMECVRQTPFSVYLDYAHTPDALEAALSGLRRCLPSPDARLHVVFGCGGDRERQKRPLMGAVAAKHADRILLTADNSRSEAVQDIIADILTGIPSCDLARTSVIEDRRDAIRHALGTAAPGDIVLLAGKGHETTQTDRLGTRPFSERQIVDAYFAEQFP